jgi:hypothetical protein
MCRILLKKNYILLKVLYPNPVLLHRAVDNARLVPKRIGESVPKFYHCSTGKPGFNYWARGTGFRRIPGFNLIPYFDDATVRIYLKLQFIKEYWKTGELFIQPSRIKLFSEKRANCIDVFEIEPISENVWKGDRIFRDGIPVEIPIGKHRLFLRLQKELRRGYPVEQTTPVQIAWLNMVDRGDWLFGKTSQIITWIIAIAALVISIAWKCGK